MNRYRLRFYAIKKDIDKDIKCLNTEIKILSEEIDEFKKELEQFEERGLVYEHARPIEKAYWTSLVL